MTPGSARGLRNTACITSPRGPEPSSDHEGQQHPRQPDRPHQAGGGGRRGGQVDAHGLERGTCGLQQDHQGAGRSGVRRAERRRGQDGRADEDDQADGQEQAAAARTTPRARRGDAAREGSEIDCFTGHNLGR